MEAYLDIHLAVEEGHHSRHNHLVAAAAGCCSRRGLPAAAAHYSHSLAEARDFHSRNLLVEGIVVEDMKAEEDRSHRAVGLRSRLVRGKMTCVVECRCRVLCCREL
jgi:hypothetical protein